MNYRPEIDGLRAIAVLLVLIFHLFPRLCSGGFIGVDVFFVISGFLITSIIYKKLLIGEFSFLEFYQRRILRIFPALFTVLGACLVLAIFVLGSRDFLALTRTTRYAAMQISNLLFAREVDYFAESHDLSPLLHTWSLGVEEQFYLLWPLVVLFFFKIGPRGQQKSVLVCIGLLSFALSLYWVQVDPQLAYYSVFSRLWELAVGGLLGLGFYPKIQDGRLAEGLSLTGLILIFGSAFLLEEQSPFPGFNAVYCVVGSGLLILATPNSNLIRKGLSLPILVFVGKISYSLYLWHWPFIAFVRNYTQDQLTVPSAFLISSASVMASYLTWRFVETPFRVLGRKQRSFQWRVVTLGLITIVGTIVMANGLKALHSADFRFLGARRVLDETPVPAHEQCHYSLKNIESKAAVYMNEACRHHAPLNADKMVIFGDSHGSHIFPAFNNFGKTHNISVHLMVSSSCPSFLTDYKMYQRNQLIERCSLFAQLAKETLLQDPSIQWVVLSMRSSQYTETTDNEEASLRTFLVDSTDQEFSVSNSRRVYREHLERTIQSLQMAGKKVVLVGQAPMLKKDPIRCLENAHVLISSLFEIDKNHCYEFDWNWVNTRLQESTKIMQALAHTYHLQYLPLKKHIPAAKVNDELIYRDDNHLNRQGAQWVAPLFNSIGLD
jgi:peptidoglycan/LPS O-acetylase OafA/YrhL